jgi:hypothetical protein
VFIRKVSVFLHATFHTQTVAIHCGTNSEIKIKTKINMNYNIKTGLIISTILIFLSIITLKYNVFGTETIIDVFIASAFIINVSLLFKVFKDKKKTVE